MHTDTNRAAARLLQTAAAPANLASRTVAALHQYSAPLRAELHCLCPRAAASRRALNTACLARDACAAWRRQPSSAPSRRTTRDRCDRRFTRRRTNTARRQLAHARKLVCPWSLAVSECILAEALRRIHAVFSHVSQQELMPRSVGNKRAEGDESATLQLSNHTTTSYDCRCCSAP